MSTPKGSGSKPIVQAFLLADRIYRDTDTGKMIIAGTFNAIRSHTFPAMHVGGAHIYLGLTDCSGEIPLKLQIKHARSDVMLGELAFAAAAVDKLRLTECNIVLPPLTFQSAGEYHIELLHGPTSSHLATIRLHVLQIDGGG